MILCELFFSALITLNQLNRKIQKAHTVVKVMMLLLKWTMISMRIMRENLMISMIMPGKLEISKHRTIDISTLLSEFCG